jgi:hypothetical protein
VAARIRQLRAAAWAAIQVVRARLAAIRAVLGPLVDIPAALLVADTRAVPVVAPCMPAAPAAVREARLRRGPSPVTRRLPVVMKYMPLTAASSVRVPTVRVLTFTTLTAAWISITAWTETDG